MGIINRPIFLVVYIFIFLHIAIGYTNAERELLSVHAIYRHGARAPIKGIEADEVRAFFYRGPGQLTDEGLKQAEVVGRILRERYVESKFLDERLIPAQFEFQSSGAERCLMTNYRVAETMFNGTVPPIFTMPENDDFMLVPKFKCVVNEYRDVLKLTDEEDASVKKNEWNLGSIAKARAVKKTKLLKDKINEQYSNLIVEKEVGLPVPAWFTNEAYEEAKVVFSSSISAYAGAGEFHNPKWLRFNSGFLLHTIFESIKKRVGCDDQKECSKEKKFYSYSTHDVTVLALLESFGIREAALGVNSSPMYCALLIIELWMVDGKPKVQVLYRRKPDETLLINLSEKVRNCGKQGEYCEVEKFSSCCGKYITSKPKQECDGNSLEESKNTSVWNFLSYILLALCLLLLIIIGYLTFLLYSRRYVNPSDLNESDSENELKSM